MEMMTFKARVRKDGTLAIPRNAREQLEAHSGEDVEVSIHTEDMRPDEEPARNPLYDIIGIAKGGRPDGAENHDRYLYGREGDQAHSCWLKRTP